MALAVRSLVLLAAAVLLAGCASAPRHPALARAEAAGTLPPLVPLRRFVANTDYEAGFALAPDGHAVLFNKPVGTDTGLAVRPLDGRPERSFATGFLPRADVAVRYAWLPDSRHVVYLKDLRGDENMQLHVFDTRSPFAPWTVTPWPGVRSYFLAWGASGSAKFFFASNRRDRSTMDLYEADAATRTIREVARSDGHVLAWFIGTDQRPAARLRQLGAQDGADSALELLQPDGSWKHLRTIGGWDHLAVHRIDPAAGKAWGTSSVGRDKSAFVEIDLASGQERVVAQHPVVDLRWVYYHRSAARPIGYVVDDGLPAMHWVDEAFGTEVAQAVQRARAQGLLEDAPRVVRPQSSSEDGRRWVLAAIGDFDAAELLLDRDTGAVARLDPREPERKRLLSPTEPFRFRASDGRTVHGYVVRPRGVAGPAPLVVSIHGGPWARDAWSSAAFNGDQLLANRGYAVLKVNYRGSTGYGRDHMMAGQGVTFTRVQDDVAEAAQWAVDQGIADPKRMAVLGASFGGFSVLAQLIHRKQDWKCGVNIVGVANWQRVIENWPPFWRNRHMFEAFYGKADDPAGRRQLAESSPITYIDRITAPLLVIHGGNDIRVLRQDSDDVVTALRALGRPVEYLSFPDEGHAVRRWRNRLEMWRRIEDHLAACLGGRSGGWDFYELMPR